MTIEICSRWPISWTFTLHLPAQLYPMNYAVAVDHPYWVIGATHFFHCIICRTLRFPSWSYDKGSWALFPPILLARSPANCPTPIVVNLIHKFLQNLALVRPGANRGSNSGMLSSLWGRKEPHRPWAKILLYLDTCNCKSCWRRKFKRQHLLETLWPSPRALSLLESHPHKKI